MEDTEIAAAQRVRWPSRWRISLLDAPGPAVPIAATAELPQLSNRRRSLRDVSVAALDRMIVPTGGDRSPRHSPLATLRGQGMPDKNQFISA